MTRDIASYKQWHGANKSDKCKFHQGEYKPKNPAKCVTPTNIYRSSWEFYFFRYLDECEKIIRWGSEPIAIPYLNPITNIEYCRKNGLDMSNPAYWKQSNYYVDVWWEIKDEQTGDIKKYFGEIKPYAQTIKPRPLDKTKGLKEARRFTNEAETYAVNQCKWAAAKKYCEERGCYFILITEHELKGLGLLK